MSTLKISKAHIYTVNFSIEQRALILRETTSVQQLCFQTDYFVVTFVDPFRLKDSDRKLNYTFQWSWLLPTKQILGDLLPASRYFIERLEV